MKNLLTRLLAAKAVFVLVLGIVGLAPAAHAQWVVFDPTNFSQNTMTAMESVAQTLKQIEEYRTQLQQYQNQIQNTVAPAAYIWDSANITINNLLRATDTLSVYKSRAGGLNAYLSQFGDVAYYRSSPCFSNGGCTPSALAELDSTRTLSAESQKRANDAIFRGLDQQQANLQSDSTQLRSLQSAAQGANGQMQAIGFANQLASHQANQLLQIRGILVAQQNAVATKMQADAAKEAQMGAADEQFRRGTYRASAARAW